MQYRTKKKIFRGIYTGLILTAFSFAGLLYFQNQRAMTATAEKCEQEGDLHFDSLVQLIEEELSDITRPAHQYVANVFTPGFDYHNEELLYSNLEKIVSENSDISGAIIGFEDEEFPGYADTPGGYGPLVRQQDSILTRIQAGATRNFKVLDWYANVDGSTGPMWSRPFFSNDKDSILISTYAIPLFNKDSKIFGKFGIDMNLSRLNEIILGFNPYPSSTVTLIHKDLTILAHHNKSYVMRKTLPEIMRRIGINPNNHPMYHAADGTKGHIEDYLGSKKMYFYYSPIKETPWVVLLYCPYDEIMEELHTLKQNTLHTAMAGFAVILFLLIITAVIKGRVLNDGGR